LGSTNPVADALGLPPFTSSWHHRKTC
jgi:hypothetical protein